MRKGTEKEKSKYNNISNNFAQNGPKCRHRGCLHMSSEASPLPTDHGGEGGLTQTCWARVSLGATTMEDHVCNTSITSHLSKLAGNVVISFKIQVLYSIARHWQENRLLNSFMVVERVELIKQICPGPSFSHIWKIQV